MTASEQSIVQFGGTSIAYLVERGRRRKTIAIAVDPVCGVSVRAPQDAPIARLDSIVVRKAKWIIERRRQYADLPPPQTPREFVNGETFLYAGKQYRLKIVDRQRREGTGVSLVGGRLCVGRGQPVRSVLVSWYRERAQEHLVRRVQIWADRIGVRPASVRVREQRTRWGSADSKGNLRFNWRIVQAPTRLLDYVVAHELVHLIHRDHTREFWATLGRTMPDYEARRENLRIFGRAMVW